MRRGRPSRPYRPSPVLAGWALCAIFAASATVLVNPGLGPSPSPTGGSPRGNAPLDPAFPHVFPPRPGAAMTVRPSAVDPNASYTTEPAPLGVTDFGVDGAGNSYSYNTTTFVGTASVDALKASGCVGTGCADVSFQLNLELVLTDPATGTEYTYWVQNVLSVDSSNRYFLALNNIWNFTGSSSSNTLNSQSVQGNGTIGTYRTTENYYYYGMACGATVYPGACTTLSWPDTLQDREVAVVQNGVPGVGFDCASGSNGWVRYDTAYFPFAKGYSDKGFYVTGASYNEHGLYDDAEFVLTGAAPGWTDAGSRANLTLQYWNGHNLQVVPNAFNHGGNTAESISNLVVSGADAGAPGLPGARLAPGKGSLGFEYGSAGVGSLTVETPLGAGTIWVNGTAFAFTGRNATFGLVPGTYLVVLSGTLVPNQAPATVTAGSNTVVRLGFGYFEPVDLTETGLGAGTLWSVAVNGQLLTSRTDRISTSLPNGTYPVRFNGGAGYLLEYSGTTIVVSGPTNVSVPFRPFTFGVNFTAAGLPAGTYWWVNVSGTTVGGNASSILVPASNGTHPYAVGTSYFFAASPATGVVQVRGRTIAVPIAFSVRPGYLAGSVTPGNAVVSIDGSAVPVDHGTFNVTVVPGAHQIVTTAAGYVTNSSLVLVTPGNVSYNAIQMEELPSGHTAPPTSPATGPSGLEWTAIAAAAAVLVGLVVVILVRRPPRAAA